MLVFIYDPMRSDHLFYLITLYIHLLTLLPDSSSLSYPGRDFTFYMGSSGNMPCWFYAVQPLAVTRVRPMPVCIIQHLSGCIVLIYRIFLYFQDLFFNHDLYLLFSLISGNPLFLHHLFFTRHQGHSFSINGLCAETLYLISLPNGGSISCLFVNFRIWMCNWHLVQVLPKSVYQTSCR